MPAGVAGCHQAGGQRHTAAAEVHTALAEGGKAVQKVLLLLVLAGVGTVQHLLLLLLQKSQQLLDSPVRCPCCWCVPTSDSKKTVLPPGGCCDASSGQHSGRLTMQ